jgi:hypothetical protein
MNFINEETTTTQEQLNLKVKSEIVNCAKRGLQMTKNLHEKSFNLIWQNEDPQAILDLFGTNAAELFYASSETEALIKKRDSAYEAPTVPYEYTVNEDGTVTVGALKDE